MKILGIIAAALIGILIGFGGGIYAGIQLPEYDVLCEDDYSLHKLDKDFYSKSGIFLPEGTIVKLRGCKPNTQGRFDFFIDNWNYEHTTKIPEDLAPTYYLGFGDDFSRK